MTKVGVIGVGYLGEKHARIYSELDEVELTAVADIDRERAEKIAFEYGAQPFTDFRDALDRADAFSIVTFTTDHHAVARECIAAGKDLLIEKPITATVEEADDLIRLSREKGVLIQVGHLERFNPAVNALYPLLDEPVFFEAERLSPFLGRGTDVDITVDLMIHDIDIILACMTHIGASLAVRDIKATVARVLTDRIDVAKVWIEFEAGLQALMTASRLSPEKSRKLRIFQKNSYLLIDYQEMKITKSVKNGKTIVREPIPITRKEPLREELIDFISCIQKRTAPVVSARQGRDALTLALKIGECIRP